MKNTPEPITIPTTKDSAIHMFKFFLRRIFVSILRPLFGEYVPITVEALLHLAKNIAHEKPLRKKNIVG
ncbi:hypothetical protein CaldiYA01_17560 [Caldicellulosiruptor diazotrophicus]|uniref:Uncharacterized protein n=1 Tax=Caldicellulosiruptor diazotrophicus TaxID=2806205 RepID=A0ABN6E8G8_9FIRM|nr:hypothetical protein CaldiYA01_17560 [Caldicellulosiruptor diazotrophicus]